MSRSEPAAEKSWLHTWAPLIAVSLAMFIVVVDSTMMTVAISAIVADLKTQVGSVQAAISIYSLVMAALMLTGARLGAIYGVKRMFVIGIGIYGVGTLLAAVSWSIGILVLGWSFIEGVAAALILPLAFTLIIANYEGAQRAFAFGILGGVQASAAAVGPILGGFLTTFFSWRWGFGGQVAVVLIILPFLPHLRELRGAEDRKTDMDWGGTGLSVLAMGTFVLGFLLAGHYGWWSARRALTIGNLEIAPFGLSVAPFLIGIGIATAAAFVHRQFRLTRMGRTPLLQMGLFQNGRFVAGLSTYILRSLFLTGLLFVFPLFLQSALGFNALRSGLAILPFSLATFVVSLGTAGWSARIAPKRLIQAGLIIMAAGILLLRRVTSMSLAISDAILPMAVFGIGLGLVMAQLVNLTLSAVESEETPGASGINNALGELGNSLGTAVIGSFLMALFFGGVADRALALAEGEAASVDRQELVIELEDAFEKMTPAQQEEMISTFPQPVQDSLETILDDSIVDAQRNTLLAIALLVGLTFVASTFLPGGSRKPDSGSDESVA